MGQHYETGRNGEKAAIAYLIKKGYQIVETNWIYNYKEIDIIAKHNNQMVFVEVKTRSSRAFELPKEAVTLKKMRHLVYAADVYLRMKEIELESRFDIISVIANEGFQIMEHLEDAFKANELL